MSQAELLAEVELERSSREIPYETLKFLEDGRSRFGSVDCFDFVPSDYELLWSILDALPRGRYCEWGSGYGIGVGLATQLGFESVGFEIDAGLADASRKLLDDHNIVAVIENSDYTSYEVPADVFFIYCWPSRQAEAERHFDETAPDHAKLLICHGQSDIRVKVKRR